MRRKSFALILIGSLVLSLASCGGEGVPVPSGQQIELIEPANAEQSYETAVKRDIYGSSIYAASVIPYIEEYSAAKSFSFGSYGAFLGEEVKKGQVIITSDTTSINERIKAKQEEIASMEEDYQKYMEKQRKDLEKKRSDEPYLKEIVGNLEDEEPAEFLPPEVEGGEPVANPAYAPWKAQMDRYEGEYRILKHSADTIELKMNQRTELYELDHKHQEYLLRALRKEVSSAAIASGMAGTVVAVANLSPGSYVREDMAMVAVADMSRKYLKCEYVNNNMIKKAKDVYAMIGGKRVEVEHQPMSPEEYTALSANGKVYSTFKILGDTDGIEVGDYAVLTVVSDQREGVVSVSKSAIHKDELGQFVYVLNGSESVRTSVQLGYSDGNFVEITSGIAEGDKILSSSVQKVGNQTAVVTRGDFSTKFSEKAELTYSSSILQKNTVKNGTMYFGECLVKMFQHVNKGDVLATVRVEPDQMAIKRNETRLARLKERYEDFKQENKDNTKEEYYQNTVENYEKQIKDIEETIAEQKKDGAVREIRAEKTGVIVMDEDNPWRAWLGDFTKEQIIQQDAFLVEIADENTCCMIVEDPNQTLQYGNKVKVTYMDAEQKSKTVEGMVGSMSSLGVSNRLRGDQARILLPRDCIEDVLQGTWAGEWWVRNKERYTIDAELRVMKDVLLVPRGAVFDIAGKTYVYVKDASGNVEAQSFISGGFNETYYFVVQGLSEGMEVCLK